MKRPQTKFHAHTMRGSQVTRSKKVKIIRSKFIVRSKFSCSKVFSLHRYFIETTTTDIDMLLQVLLQFCNNSGLVATSGVIMPFCPLLDDCIVCRIGMVRQETWSHSTWFGKCSIHYVYKVSTMFSGLTLL